MVLQRKNITLRGTAFTLFCFKPGSYSIRIAEYKYQPNYNINNGLQGNMTSGGKTQLEGCFEWFSEADRYVQFYILGRVFCDKSVMACLDVEARTRGLFYLFI